MYLYCKLLWVKASAKCPKRLSYHELHSPPVWWLNSHYFSSFLSAEGTDALGGGVCAVLLPVEEV